MKKIVKVKYETKLGPVIVEPHYVNYIGRFKVCSHASKEAADHCASKLQAEIERVLTKKKVKK